MNRSEEEETQIQMQVTEEEPAPSILKQVIVLAVFLGAIFGLPAIVEKYFK